MKMGDTFQALKLSQYSLPLVKPLFGKQLFDYTSDVSSPDFRSVDWLDPPGRNPTKAENLALQAIKNKHTTER